MNISKIWNIFDDISEEGDEVDVKEEDSEEEPQMKKVHI